MTLTDELVEKAAKAIWEVNFPNPPGWKVWSDHSEWGPSIDQRRVTIERARAALSAVLPDVIAAERERCAKVAEQQREVFGSNEYALGQPLSSFAERFACGCVAAAIRKGDA